MKLLLYGVCHQREPPDVSRLRGTRDEPLSLVAHAGLAAAVSRAPDDPSAPTVRVVKEYAAVVAALHGQVSTLPVRYGCLSASAAEVKRLLRRQRSSLLAALEAVGGCSEQTAHLFGAERDDGVSLPCRAEAPPAPNSGAAHLRRLKRRYEERDMAVERVGAWVEALRKALKGLFVASKTEPAGATVGPSAAAAATVHFLVRQECLPPFREAAESATAGPGVRLLLTGPWPPYNFADPVGNGDPSVPWAGPPRKG